MKNNTIEKMAFYLYMSFVSIDRTGELSLLSHSFCKYHDLLEEEDCHLLELVVGPRVGILSAQEGTPQQQFTLSHYFTLNNG
jgi:hypothetical protein